MAYMGRLTPTHANTGADNGTRYTVGPHGLQEHCAAVVTPARHHMDRQVQLDRVTVPHGDGHAVELDLPVHVMSGKGYDGCAVLLQTMRSDGVPGAIIGAGVVMDGKSS